MKYPSHLNLKTIAIVIISSHLFFELPGYAQDTTLFHFPLDNGDFWEYARKTGTLVTPTTHKVIGDTILPNNVEYMHIEEFNPQFGTRFNFLRLETSTKVHTILPYTVSNPLDTLLFHLELFNGKEWRTGLYADIAALMHVDSVYQAEFFGQVRKAARIVLPEITFGIFEYIIVDSLGIYFIGFEGGTETLVGAVIDNTRYGIFTDVREIENDVHPFSYSLLQNYPNPFNPETIIQYSLPKNGKVELSVFNLLGQKVNILVNKVQQAGIYRTVWDGKNAIKQEMPSGVYLYLLKTAEYTTMKKMTLLR